MQGSWPPSTPACPGLPKTLWLSEAAQPSQSGSWGPEKQEPGTRVSTLLVTPSVRVTVAGQHLQGSTSATPEDSVSYTNLGVPDSGGWTPDDKR